MEAHIIVKIFNGNNIIQKIIRVVQQYPKNQNKCFHKGKTSLTKRCTVSITHVSKALTVIIMFKKFSKWSYSIQQIRTKIFMNVILHYPKVTKVQKCLKGNWQKLCQKDWSCGVTVSNKSKKKIFIKVKLH